MYIHMGSFCHCGCALGGSLAVDLGESHGKTLSSLVSPVVLRLLANNFQTGLEPADLDGSRVSRFRLLGRGW